MPPTGDSCGPAPLEAIRRHWPDGPALVEAAGAAPWGPINEVDDTERAASVLDFRPRYGFHEYMEALREGRDTLQARGHPA